jgi:translation initiation factor 2-alpha kinase 4
MTSVPQSHEREKSDPFKVKMEDLDDYSSDKTSFPSIHFTRSEIKDDNREDDDDEDDDDSDGEFGNLFSSEYITDVEVDIPKDTIQPRTLYIQMVRLTWILGTSLKSSHSGICRAPDAERGTTSD